MSLPETDKKSIALRFGRKARHYNSRAVVQPLLLERVALTLNDSLGPHQLWIDIGSGPGTLLEKLKKLPPGLRFICIDLASQSLKIIGKNRSNELMVHPVCADAEGLPLREACADGAVIASMLQWSHCPTSTLTQAASILKSSSPLHFSIFTEGTFRELFAVRKKNGFPPSMHFPSQRELIPLFDSAGFDVSTIKCDMFREVKFFGSAHSALKSLSSIGATANPHKPLNKSEFSRLCIDYESCFVSDKGIPMTYHALTGKIKRKKR